MRIGSGAIAALVVGAAAACSSESKDETPNVSEPVGPAGELAQEGAGGDTWPDLYRDFFGPSARSSCAATTCHGSPESSGARGSHGFVCADQDQCRESMLSPDTGLVQLGDVGTPSESTLVQILRRRSESGGIVGVMPKSSRYVFSDDSIERIETWIGNGASP